MRSPVNRHRFWQLVADAALIAVAWLLAFQLRFDSFGKIPPFYEKLVNWETVLLVVAIKLVVFTDVRLLQPLVALRVHAGHVGRGARGHGRMPRGQPRRLLLPARGHRAAPARDRHSRLAAPARARRGLAPAGSHDLRATRRFEPRRPRQGGRDRRRRGRGSARDPRDAEVARARVHADRSRRRRPAQEEPPAPRCPRAGDDRRASAHPPGQQAGRAPDRDPLRLRRSAPEGGRVRTRRAGSREDAARPLRPDLRRLEPRGADPPRAGRGHPRPRAGRGRLRGDRRVPARRDGSHLGRGRLDRVRALPPGGPSRRREADPRRPGRVAPLRDRARARRRPRLPGSSPRDRGRRQPREAALGLRALPAERRLPRRGLQARADDGGEPARVGAEQRSRDEGARPGRGRVQGEALRPRLDRQGSERAGGLRPVEGALRVDRRDVRRARRGVRPASSPCASGTSSTPPAR